MIKDEKRLLKSVDSLPTFIKNLNAEEKRLEDMKILREVRICCFCECLSVFVFVFCVCVYVCLCVFMCLLKCFNVVLCL